MSVRDRYSPPRYRVSYGVVRRPKDAATVLTTLPTWTKTFPRLSDATFAGGKVRRGAPGRVYHPEDDRVKTT